MNARLEHRTLLVKFEDKNIFFSEFEHYMINITFVVHI